MFRMFPTSFPKCNSEVEEKSEYSTEKACQIPVYANIIIRELEQRRRRRRLLKNEFIFYKRNSRLSRSVRYVIRNASIRFQMEIRKISRRRPRSVGDAELGHFTLLSCRGRQRIVQRFLTQVHSYCFAH